MSAAPAINPRHFAANRAYETHLLHYLEEFAPVGMRETQLVQNLADTQ